MRFTKMQGAGNDYIYVDCFAEPMPERPDQLARRARDRHFGIGGDGLILICPSQQADARMRMFNADGSEAEMCGNGIRCLAKYLYDHGRCRRKTLAIETGRGVLSLELEVGGDGRVERVRVDMGEPILQPDRMPTTLPGDPAQARRRGRRCPPDGRRPHDPRHLRVDGQPALRHLRRVVDRARRAGARPAGRDRSAFSPAGQCRIRGSGLAGRGADARLGARLRRDAGLRHRRLRRVRGGRSTGRTARRSSSICPAAISISTGPHDDHVYLTGPAVEVFQGQWEDA